MARVVSIACPGSTRNNILLLVSSLGVKGVHQMRFELVKKVPIVEIDGARCFLDTGYPYGVDLVDSRVQQSFGIPGLHVAGVGSLKRYTKFDYPNCEITTSDDPIPLEGGQTITVKAPIDEIPVFERI